MRVLTIIPTYNELESLPKTLGRLRTAVPESDVLVVDDNSPDGTGQLADGIAAEDKQVHVLHSKGKEGLGAAYIAGFKWAMEQGYEFVFEMDGDFSHNPDAIPEHYLRFLHNGFRTKWGFLGTPLRIIMRRKTSE